MMKRLLQLVLTGFMASSAWACKYNVRDVGFVDWDPAPYRLLALTDSQTDPVWVKAVRFTAPASFLEANVELSLQEPATPAMLTQYSIDKLPALVLVSPDDRSLPIPWNVAEESTQAAIWAALESVVSSPRREALLSRVVEAYAVVLVAEGTDPAENQRARQAAESAVERIGPLLARLPKAINVPPEVMVLDQETARNERVLLWSLGAEGTDEAIVAIVYGRARRVGPLLQGALITETAIYRALAVLGQDCECDLDRAWMTGPLLPARWGREQQEAVQRMAGFDAESPLIKVEISRIVARGPSAEARTVGLPARGGLDFDVLGYTEISVEELTAESDETTPGLMNEEAAGQTMSAGAMQAAAAPPVAGAPSQRRPAWGLLTLIAIVSVGLGGGALLWWRSRGND